MIFYREGRREVRPFVLSRDVFRRLQIMVEDIRPQPGDGAPAHEFAGADRYGCDHCDFSEVNTVHWHRDDGQVTAFVVTTFLANDNRADPFLRAQNVLLEEMLPSLLGHPQTEPK